MKNNPPDQNVGNSLTSFELLTVQQVCEILKVNRNIVYDLINCGLLRSFQLGSTKITTKALEEFMTRCDNGEIHYVPSRRRQNGVKEGQA